MSDTRKRNVTTYDYSKNITDLTINPSFINGLETVTSMYILNSSEEDRLKVPDAMKKFIEIVQHDPNGGKEKPELELDSYEQTLYILFALTNYFKHEAEKQGIATTEEVEITNKDLESMQSQLEKSANDGTLMETMQTLAKSLSEQLPSKSS